MKLSQLLEKQDHIVQKEVEKVRLKRKKEEIGGD